MEETLVVGGVNGREAKGVHCSMPAIGLLMNHLSKGNEGEEK